MKIERSSVRPGRWLLALVVWWVSGCGPGGAAVELSQTATPRSGAVPAAVDRHRVRAMKQQQIWRLLEGPAPPTPRRFPTVTATLAGAVVFGGRDAAGAPVGDPWRWDGETWHALAQADAPSARTGHAATALPTGLCVWGGRDGGGLRDDGACWDATANRWTATPTVSAPSPRTDAACAWDGARLVLFGGADEEGETFADGATWAPGAGRWEPLPAGPRARRRALFASADGSPESGAGLVLGGGVGEALALGAEDAALWQGAAARWVPLDRAAVPPAQEGPLWVATDHGPVVLGRDAAVRFDPTTARWVPLPTQAMPSVRYGAAVVAAPGAVLVWGGRDATGLRGDGAVLDLRAGRWLPLPEGPAPRQDAVLVAVGARALLLWGADDAGLRTEAWALDLDALGVTARGP